MLFVDQPFASAPLSAHLNKMHLRIQPFVSVKFSSVKHGRQAWEDSTDLSLFHLVAEKMPPSCRMDQ